MRAEIHLNSQDLVKEITQEVIKAMKPLLANGRTEEDRLFTVKTLAQYLEVSPQWVYERVHLKEVPYIKMGKFPRFKKSDVDRWMDTYKMPAMNPLSRPLKAIK